MNLIVHHVEDIKGHLFFIFFLCKLVIIVLYKNVLLLQMAACLVYPVVYYHAMYVSTVSFLPACSLAVLIYLIENHIGQNWIESADFAMLNTVKSVDTWFVVTDVYNRIYLSLFHNVTTLLIRLDFRLDIMDSSNATLRKILDRMKKVP